MSQFWLSYRHWLYWLASVAQLDARPTGDQEVAGCGFDPCWVGNILSLRLVMKYFLQAVSPFHWFKKVSFLQKNVHNIG